MNANYEHDKAALAKEDPLFAKNRFWDVGHAEGRGMRGAAAGRASGGGGGETGGIVGPLPEEVRRAAGRPVIGR